MKVILADLFFKTESGSFIAEKQPCLDVPKELLQRDSFLMGSLFDDKLKGFMAHLIIDKKTGFPLITKVEFRKELSESNMSMDEYLKRLV